MLDYRESPCLMFGLLDYREFSLLHCNKCSKCYRKAVSSFYNRLSHC